jgi:hypothetical protein
MWGTLGTSEEHWVTWGTLGTLGVGNIGGALGNAGNIEDWSESFCTGMGARTRTIRLHLSLSDIEHAFAQLHSSRHLLDGHFDRCNAVLVVSERMLRSSNLETVALTRVSSPEALPPRHQQPPLAPTVQFVLVHSLKLHKSPSASTLGGNRRQRRRELDECGKDEPLPAARESQPCQLS